MRFVCTSIIEKATKAMGAVFGCNRFRNKNKFYKGNKQPLL